MGNVIRIRLNLTNFNLNPINCNLNQFNNNLPIILISLSCLFRYSSIGTKKDTLPNLRLMIKENGNLHYLPAYKLDDENSERLNRKKERS